MSGAATRSRQAAPSGPKATQREVGAVLLSAVAALTPGADRALSDGKLGWLRAAEAEGIAPERLGEFVAQVSDHPWVVGLRGRIDLDAFLAAWPRLSDAGSSRNRTTLARDDEDPAVLVVDRQRLDGGTTDVLEDRFVIGLLRGLLHRTARIALGTATATPSSDGRRWRVPAAPAITPPPANEVQWGAVGPLSEAVLDRLDHTGATALGDMAAALAMSSRSLQRGLAAEGTTFRDVSRRARLARAARAVAAGQNLTDAAHEVGFSDGAHLSPEFKELVGTRAVDWRRWGEEAPTAG